MEPTGRSLRIRNLLLGVFLFGAILGLTVEAGAEALDLGKIPRDVQKGWCNAHNGQYLEWGGKDGAVVASTCTTNTGGAMYCDKNTNCTGYPPKQGQKSAFSFPKAGGGSATMSQNKPPLASGR